MAKISIDFGSSNSGACINQYDDDYNASQLRIIHNQGTFNAVAKQPTEFWIKRSLMNSGFDDIKNNMRVLSCVQNDTQDFNIIWTRSMIEREIDKVKNNNEWICFRRFKMNLYKNERNVTAGGSSYSLDKVIAVFLRVIANDCMAYCTSSNLQMAEEDIEWGVTVPAIWEEEQIGIMRNIISTSLKGKSLLLREPECALVGIALNNKKEINWEEGRVTLVVDAGGGTTDLAYMEEKNDDTDGWHYSHLAIVKGDAAGGNEIDNAFWQLFAKKLADMSNVDLPLPAQTLWNEFGDEQPAERMKMEDIWANIKSNISINNYQGYFDPTGNYKKWLSRHGYQQIVKAIDDNFGVPIDECQIIEECFDPTVKKIESAVINMLNSENTPSKLRLAFAGGLSAYKPLRDRVTRIVQDKLGEKNVELMLNDAGSTNDSAMQGAIIFGGAYILTKGRYLIRRIARKTFLTDFVQEYEGFHSEEAFWKHMSCRIANEYYMLGVNINKAIELTNDSFIKYGCNKKLRGSSAGFLADYLHPLCLKGKAAYEKRIIPFVPLRKGCTKVLVNIYSTHEPVVPFPMDECPELHQECRIEYDFGYSWEQAYVEVDFNEAGEGLIVFRILDENKKQVAEKKVAGGVQRGL